MTTRLTDEELRLIEARANEMDVTHHTTARAMRRAVAELQARRAADLTAQDVEALRTIVNSVNEWGSVCVSEVALSVVRRIIAGGGK